MNIKIIIIFFLISFFIGCDSAKGSSTSGTGLDSLAYQDSVQTDATANSEHRAKPIDIDILKDYLLKSQRMADRLEGGLQSMSPSEVDNYYWNEDYRFDKTTDFEKIDSMVLPLVTRWFNDNEGASSSPEDKAVLHLLKQAGFIPVYLGEGYTELRINPYFYYNIFKSYTTPEMSTYIKICAAQDNIISMDAGIVVPPDTLLARVVSWENYLKQYPETKYREKALAHYAEYVGLLLFCSYDNTPIFDRNSQIIENFNLEAIKQLKGRYPDTNIDNMISFYLDELKKNKNRYTKDLEDKVMNWGLLKNFDKSHIY